MQMNLHAQFLGVRPLFATWPSLRSERCGDDSWSAIEAEGDQELWQPQRGHRPGSEPLPGHSGATRPRATATTTSARSRPVHHNMMLGYRESLYTQRMEGISLVFGHYVYSSKWKSNQRTAVFVWFKLHNNWNLFKTLWSTSSQW